MGKTNKLVTGLPSNRATKADLTINNQNLIDRVLTDPSLFPDEFTAWIPRWIMQNVNFKVTQQQLPTVGALHLVGATGEVAVFQNGWSNFGAGNEQAGYYKDPWNRVYLTGTTKGGTVAAGSTGTMFTLPAGFRPQYPSIFAVISNGALGLVTVQVDGSVRAESGNNTYFSLSGLNFRQFA